MVKPKIKIKDIIASSFTTFDEINYEIVYACKIYVPVLENLIENSKMKIKELTEHS